ncbi:MAG: SLC13 family permease [Planctomycetota bacterium]
MAVHRNGERLTNKIGNIRLEAGDTLLLQTHGAFVNKYRNSREFYLVSTVGGDLARRHDRAIPAFALFFGLIAWLTFSSLLSPPPDQQKGPTIDRPAASPDEPSSEPPAESLSWRTLFDRDIHAIAAVTIVLAMIVARCMTTSEARAAIDLQVLLIIGAAIGLGSAVQQSGAAKWLASTLIDGAAMLPGSPEFRRFTLLAVVYLVAQLLTEVITNVAVATIMITIAIDVALLSGCDPRPFIMAVAFAASLSFATPIGYQTNLMVMGPGGYRSLDYLRTGLPLALLMTMAAICLIPRAFPF